MTPSPDPTLFAVFELAIAGPLLIIIAVQEWRQVRAIRRARAAEAVVRRNDNPAGNADAP